MSGQPHKKRGRAVLHDLFFSLLYNLFMRVQGRDGRYGGDPGIGGRRGGGVHLLFMYMAIYYAAET